MKFLDLGFARLLAETATPLGVAMPVDLSVLMIGVRERQACGTTARMQAAILRDDGPRADGPCARTPVPGGAFCTATAMMLREWKGP